MYSIPELTEMLDGGMDVYKYYISPEVKLKKKFLSPFRDEENPSFCLFQHSKNGEIYFKDHAGSFGNHWTFIQEMFNLDFKDAVSKVKQEVLEGKINTDHTRVKKKRHVFKPTSTTEINIEPRPFNTKDLAFFGKACIHKETLELFNVKACTSFTITKDSKSFTIKETFSSPIYAFVASSGRIKIYRPNEAKFKWTSNYIGEEDIFGFHLLPDKCENIFILAGNRDTMSFHQNVGIPCIALNSESANLPSSVFHILSLIADNVYALYDNDDTGRKHGALLEELYGIKSMNGIWREGGGINDFCDFVEKHPSKIEEFKIELYSRL